MRWFAQTDTGQGGKGGLCCFLSILVLCTSGGGTKLATKPIGCCDPAGDGHGDELVLSTLSTQQTPSPHTKSQPKPYPTSHSISWVLPFSLCPWVSESVRCCGTGYMECHLLVRSLCGRNEVRQLPTLLVHFFFSLSANSSVNTWVISKSTWAQECHCNHNLSKICRVVPPSASTSTHLWAAAGCIMLAGEIVTSTKFK